MVGPQATQDDLKVTPGPVLKAGYDLTLPSNQSTVTVAGRRDFRIQFGDHHCQRP